MFTRIEWQQKVKNFTYSLAHWHNICMHWWCCLLCPHTFASLTQTHSHSCHAHACNRQNGARSRKRDMMLAATIRAVEHRIPERAGIHCTWWTSYHGDRQQTKVLLTLDVGCLMFGRFDSAVLGLSWNSCLYRMYSSSKSLGFKTLCSSRRERCCWMISSQTWRCWKQNHILRSLLQMERVVCRF